MKLLIISDAPIIKKKHKCNAYAPYVKEIDIWIREATESLFICPTTYKKVLLTEPLENQQVKIRSVKRLAFHTPLSIITSLLLLPYQTILLFKYMRTADHIHLRAPGNLVLLACIVQIFFPRKKKTAKYAGNWDPKASQPLAYRLQKRILSSTRLTKNMQVLVYGNWPEQTKNIKSFFTATYASTEKVYKPNKSFDGDFKAVFAGTLGANKRPLETIKLVESINASGISIQLDMFGDGPLRKDLENYIYDNNLLDSIRLHGNKPSETVKRAYQDAHFTILLSQSEGWPKAVAEGMFWGAVPIVSRVSCLPWMLNDGERGVLINDVAAIDIIAISNIMKDSKLLKAMSIKAMDWSRHYTIDTFTTAIKELLK